LTSVIRTFIAMTLFAFCWVAVGYGIFQMLSVGTCASGGPYEIARECPDGIEAVFFSLMGGILGLFVAAGIYLSRGKPPGAPDPQNGGVIVWFWTGLFWALAAGCFLAVWGPEANPGPGGELGGLIVGFMGLIFGAGGLLALKLGDGRKPKRKGILTPAVAKLAGAATPFTPPDDPVDRLEKLDRLRRQGTLTEAEFETLKARILGEG
jgi:peptidoglycan/LPS O-acetylase OafA/YrhL